MQTKKLINEILTKQIIPTKIYKGSVNNLLTIEVVTINPITYISLIYKTETLRDEAYLKLDEAAFWGLSFNPNYTPIPGPPM
jgi:hypothetical protein